MSKVIFLSAILLSACSDPAALSVDCSKGTQASDGTTVVCGDNSGDNSGNVIGSPSANTMPPASQSDAGAGIEPPPVDCGSYASIGPWIRADGSPSLFPKFAAESDGKEWATVVAADDLKAGDTIRVMVQQAGPDSPIAPATFAIEIYDNADGWSTVHEVLDEPSAKPHALSMRLDADPSPNSSIRVVVQAPASNAGEDAALWFLSTAMVDQVCPP